MEKFGSSLFPVGEDETREKNQELRKRNVSLMGFQLLPE
jgi:hypothetical protein